MCLGMYKCLCVGLSLYDVCMYTCMHSGIPDMLINVYMVVVMVRHIVTPSGCSLNHTSGLKV